MVPTIILGAAIVVPALIIIALRADAPVIFLSLCAGFVLTEFMGENAILAASTFGSNADYPKYVIIGILALPVLLSAFFLRNTVKSTKFVINLLPAFAVGLCLVLLLEEHLPAPAQTQLHDSQFWSSLANSRDLIIGGATLIAFVALWLMHRPLKEGGHGSKKKH